MNRKWSILAALAAALALIACGDDDASSGGGSAGSVSTTSLDTGDWWRDGGTLTCDGTGARFATHAISHTFGAGQAFGQATFPELVLGPPHGAGCCAGSEHVVSLGNGGTVTVGFANNAIVDGPGPDFIVFENAFEVGGDPENVFAELATVEVSEDGTTWLAFSCTATEPPFGACAGWHPVFANPHDNDIDPTDPAAAGGDGFDLADVGLNSARFVRITDRPDLAGARGVFDLDAVAIVNAACP